MKAYLSVSNLCGSLQTSGLLCSSDTDIIGNFCLWCNSWHHQTVSLWQWECLWWSLRGWTVSRHNTGIWIECKNDLYGYTWCSVVYIMTLKSTKWQSCMATRGSFELLYTRKQSIGYIHCVLVMHTSLWELQIYVMLLLVSSITKFLCCESGQCRPMT